MDDFESVIVDVMMLVGAKGWAMPVAATKSEFVETTVAGRGHGDRSIGFWLFV